MPLIVNELQRRGLKYPVLVGGAAINRRFGWRILFTEDGAPYEPGVFYCKDAFEGLSTMDALIDVQARGPLLANLHQQAERELGRAAETKKDATVAQRSTVPPAPSIPRPPSWGARLVKQMPLEMVFQRLFKNELFRLSWGAKNAHGEEWQRLEADFEARLDKMKRRALLEGEPQVYGTGPPRRMGMT
jgi:5-methyltetrahydrofolate--homocysteine methyltransferase